MIVVICANGAVGFSITRQVEADTLTWKCIDDGATQTSPRTPAGFRQLLGTMKQHAVALVGAFQQVVDLPEIF